MACRDDLLRRLQRQPAKTARRDCLQRQSSETTSRDRLQSRPNVKIDCRKLSTLIDKFGFKKRHMLHLAAKKKYNA
jgi:hypothetical protein